MHKSDFVPDWLARRAALTPARIGLTDHARGSDVTFDAWNRRVNQTARFLQRLGVCKGDLVSVYASNCAEYLDLLFACNKLGTVQHNLNWRLTSAELCGIVSEARPAVVLYSSRWAEGAEALRDCAPSECKFVGIDLRDPASGLTLGARAEEDDANLASPDLSPDDPWAIFYTGGTTGLPKGAVLTYASMAWNSVNTVTGWGLTADHVAPLQLPLFHVGGPNIFMLPLVHLGGRTILCDGFDPDETFDLIEGGDVTHFVGVPTMFIMLQEHPRWEQVDFGHLELVISGGAPCPLPVMQRFWDRGVAFKMGYGLTEAAGNNFWLPDELVQARIGSVGFPLFHVDVRIQRADGSEAAVDEEGELSIRGPHLMAGYFNRPQETAEALRDGWLYTGDVARCDADGCVYVVGRLKEMFISGGENVYPAEVEAAIHAHPAVAEVALISVPHDRWGEVGQAFVVLREGRMIDEEGLLTFLEGRLARYKRPQGIIFVPELPRTAIGKIDKTGLAEKVAAPRAPSTHQPTHCG